MTSIHLNDIALRKKIEKLPLSYYINVKSESEFSKNFSKIFFFNVISQTYPKMVLRNAVLQKFCHHKNGSKPFPSLLGSLGLNLLNKLRTFPPFLPFLENPLTPGAILIPFHPNVYIFN